MDEPQARCCKLKKKSKRLCYSVYVENIRKGQLKETVISWH